MTCIVQNCGDPARHDSNYCQGCWEQQVLRHCSSKKYQPLPTSFLIGAVVGMAAIFLLVDQIKNH